MNKHRPLMTAWGVRCNDCYGNKFSYTHLIGFSASAIGPKGVQRFWQGANHFASAKIITHYCCSNLRCGRVPLNVHGIVLLSTSKSRPQSSQAWTLGTVQEWLRQGLQLTNDWPTIFSCWCLFIFSARRTLSQDYPYTGSIPTQIRPAAWTIRAMEICLLVQYKNVESRLRTIILYSR